MAFDLQGMLSHTISAASLHDQDRIELNQKCCCVATQSILTDWIKLQLIRLTGREMPDLKKNLSILAFIGENCFQSFEFLSEAVHSDKNIVSLTTLRCCPFSLAYFAFW